MKTHAIGRAVAGVGMVLLAPAVALACPVCGLASTGDNQSSYVSMSVMLSALPLGMIAGMSVWLYRKNR